ncbi:MAG: DsbA family protein [Chloroflexota bacterium]|jgi:protein-disulfide isomerase
MKDKPSPSPREKSTITLKRSQFYMILVVLAFGVGLLVGYAWGSGTSAAAPAAVQQAATAIPRRVAVETEGYPSQGPADAPITIVEFSDFQCPFCRKFYLETYKGLLAAYPGQIRFVYRNFPLTNIHPEAFPSAVASLCAHDQGAFWDYHDKLLSSADLGRDIYLQYAADLGLDEAAFQECLSSGKHDATVSKDSDYAMIIGVGSTPTFYINGYRVEGAYPLEYFKQVIDQELAGTLP